MILEKIFLDGKHQDFSLSYHKGNNCVSFEKEGSTEPLNVLDFEEVETLAIWINQVMSKISELLDDESRERVLADKETNSEG